MLTQMRGVFSEFERYKIRERTTRGRKQQAEMGFRPSGRPPYGYSYQALVRGRGELVIDEAQAAIVTRMFNEAAAGATTADIARGLNKDGIPPSAAARWAKETVAAMLRRSVYTGVSHYNKRFAVEPTRRRGKPREGKSKLTGQRLRPQEEWIELEVPRIIDPKLFERVREGMERTRALHVGRPSRSYLLRGLMKCSA